MVKKINKDNKTRYECEECGFIYGDNNLAEKCESWCKKNHSCNLDITKYSIK